MGCGPYEYLTYEGAIDRMKKDAVITLGGLQHDDHWHSAFYFGSPQSTEINEREVFVSHFVFPSEEVAMIVAERLIQALALVAGVDLFDLNRN